MNKTPTFEIWRDIEGYDGEYSVSNLGNVRSNKSDIILKQSIASSYNYVPLSKGKRRTRSVHRLVALHFIPNPNNLPQANHIDGNKRNNSASNLEWVTRKDNIRHAFRLNLARGRKMGRHNLAKLVLNTQTGIYYECIKEACIAHGTDYWYTKDQLSPTTSTKNRTDFIRA